MRLVWVILLKRVAIKARWLVLALSLALFYAPKLNANDVAAEIERH